MAEPPSSPSSKAPMSLCSSSSPSPITTTLQASSYDKYQPYVLVKGSMGEPLCSNAEQRNLCIWKSRSSLSQVHKKEEGGICLDEASYKVSSTLIPSMSSQQSKSPDYSQLQAKSLPSSPTKTTTTTSCSIDDLRAAINQMKESSKWHDLTQEEEDATQIYAHLPLELREEGELFKQRSNSKEIISTAGMEPYSPSFPETNLAVAPSCSLKDQKKKKDHSKLATLKAPKPNSIYPGTNMPYDSQTSPKVNYTIPTSQLFSGPTKQ